MAIFSTPISHGNSPIETLQLGITKQLALFNKYLQFSKIGYIQKFNTYFYLLIVFTPTRNGHSPASLALLWIPLGAISGISTLSGRRNRPFCLEVLRFLVPRRRISVDDEAAARSQRIPGPKLSWPGESVATVSPPSAAPAAGFVVI